MGFFEKYQQISKMFFVNDGKDRCVKINESTRYPNLDEISERKAGLTNRHLCYVNGEVIVYDLCTKVKSTNLDKYDYIGQGIIYSVNGTKQTSIDVGDPIPDSVKLYYFYRMKK